jgi:hypothetical protein
VTEQGVGGVTEQGVGGEQWAETKNVAVSKILCFFWYIHVNQKLLLEDQTINAVYYTYFHEWLVKRMNSVRPNLYIMKDWFLLHNNAMSCNTATVKQMCLAGRVQCLVIYPTCLTSPH